MKEKLIELIPEFNLIEDKDLREKVLLAFELAIKEGGWKVSELQKIPFTLIQKKVFVNIIDHIRAVTLICVECEKILKNIYGERIKINHDILIAGALLHDIGKFLEIGIENEKFVKSASGKLLRHPFGGVALAARCNVPDEILHIIAVHSKEGDDFKRTLEAVILHHADFTSFETLG